MSIRRWLAAVLIAIPATLWAQPRTVSPWSDGTADAMDQAADR